MRSVVDICCGWAPKIELALINTNFEGKVTIIDKSKENLKLCRTLLDPFTKKYSVFYQQEDILDTDLPRKATTDLIIANHIIDDLFIDIYLSPKRLKSNPFCGKSDLKKIQTSIIRSPDLKKLLIRKLCKYIGSVSRINGLVIISQYPSYLEKLFQMTDFFDFCIDTVRKVFESLIRNWGFREYPLHFEDKNAYFKNNHLFCLKKIRQSSPPE